MARDRHWVRVTPLRGDEKAEVGAACLRLIDEVLKPRHLPEIRPTAFNYPVDIRGRWRTNAYSFIVRFRSGYPENEGEEFDAPFARVDHLEERSDARLFDVLWRRHTGRWWLLHREVPLEEALRLVATDPVLRPPV